jgi:hypothetical protein
VTDPREKEFRDTRRDDPARFLRELRELRSHAGLGHAELAARAHYPLDAIKAAETGPALPDLPVLSAYVRGCGGTVAEWEERWRAVTDSPASPLLTARGAAWSEAADAGARVGAESFPADEEDSDRVIAALNRVADRMAASASSSPSGARNADVWTPAAPEAGNTDVRTPEPSAARDTDVWTPATPEAGGTDVWTPATPEAGGTDVWTPAPRTREPGTVTDSIAAQAVPLTRREADALTAGMAAGSGDRSRAADTGTRRPNAPAGMPVPTGRTASRRSAHTSRTTLTVYAVIALLLAVTLIALFA